MRFLIINADGYGFTAGITRAIEECVKFGTVRSVSVNVNFESAQRIRELVRSYPDLSVGCHINPVVGRPVLDSASVPSLVDERGEFFYKYFATRFLHGRIRPCELRAEMVAQVEKTRELAGGNLSHLDFHMGLQRLPGLYSIFLDVAEASGVRRIRTHRYTVGMESRFPAMRNFIYMFESGTRIPKYLWNLWLRRKATVRRLASPDRRVEITYLGLRESVITATNYISMLGNLPEGFNEFVAHPGYVDTELMRWSTYVRERESERKALLDQSFKSALAASGILLAGYRDIPLM